MTRSIDVAATRFDDARMPALRVVLFLLLTLIPLHGFGQEADSGKFFDDARLQIATIRKQLAGDVDDTNLNAFRDGAVAIAAEADALVADRTPKLAELDARLSELGPPPDKGSPPEAADIVAQRTAITKQREALDAEIKRAKLLSVDSQQLVAAIAETRAAGLQARLSQRTPSPLSPSFWNSVAANFASDSARLEALRIGVVSAVKDSFAPDNRPYAIGGIAIGVLLIVFGRWWAERALMRFTADRVPQGRLRRSALALAVVTVATVFAGFGAQAIVSGLAWHDAFSDAEKQLARSLVAVVFMGSFVAGLGRALLSPTRPSWRLPPIADDVALRLRAFPLLLGAAIVLSIMLRRINSIVDASISATIAAMLVGIVLYTGLIVWTLIRIRGAVHARAVDAQGDAAPGKMRSRSPWVGLGFGAFWLGCIVTLIAAVSGFVAFAQFLAQQMVWTTIVAAAFYLLVHLIEDLCSTLIAARSQWMESTLGVHDRTLRQAAVVLSGALRVVAFVFALSLVLTRFGSGPAELLTRGAQVGSRGLSIGQIAITPVAVFGAIAVFLLGLMVIRALQRWLGERYLPTTSLDPAMRSSVTTLLGYAGGVVVFAFALSELGISVERIAWVASALSVGIGFGLQAVVQNFVSGLILLVERPVKVGDWIALGDLEGDIRRINVRATEIQMGDRSTVIVPNSELITKTVRNVTLGNAEGRVRIRLPMPLDADADRVIAVMRDVFGTHPSVLGEPAPSVTLDGIENSALIFIGVAFIGNPRQSGAVRSEILLAILSRLREAGIPMVTPQELTLRRQAETTPRALPAPP
jgi:potassium-dependent mechanosensitive channel